PSPPPATSADDDIEDAEVVDENGPRCWSELDDSQRAGAVFMAPEWFGAPWEQLTIDQRAALVAHTTGRTVDEVITAQREHPDDPGWLAGTETGCIRMIGTPAFPSQPYPRCGRPAAENSQYCPGHNPAGGFDSEIGEPVEFPAGPAGVFNLDFDSHGVCRTRDGEVEIVPWSELPPQAGQLANDAVDAARAGDGQRAGELARDIERMVAAAFAARSTTGHSPDSDVAPTAAPAHDPDAIAAGPTTEGAPPMTAPIGSGETTTIASARAYYTRLSEHAMKAVAAQIELSRSYLTGAEMGDPKVLNAISHTHEVATMLAAAARSVLEALAAHNLMEEAVASTPGAAKTDFYRPV
ncbi:MAG: hypothetical protein ACQSGP_10200, partial [Frankia sp.]